MKFLARIIPLVLFVPFLAHAAGISTAWLTTSLNTVKTFINGTLVPLVFALAFIAFIWGMFKAFILGGADEEKQSEGKQLMIYAIVGFAVMVGVWGLVNIVTNMFGLTGNETYNIPAVPTPRP